MSKSLCILYLIVLSCCAPCRCLAIVPVTAFALPNGLRVIVYERRTSPLVAIGLWVRAGARQEQADEIGSAHFLEHTLFKGTTTRRAGDADIAIENLGAVLDAATGPDYAQFYTTVGSVHLTAALGIVADVVRNATLPEAEIERERGVILDELAQHDADPTARLIDLLFANGLSAHPYSRSPGGTPAGIRARKRDTLAAFYHRYYTPSRCTLILVGDCTVEQARTEAERAFGDWNPPDTDPPSQKHSTIEHLTTEHSITAQSAIAMTDHAAVQAPDSTPRHIEIRAAVTYPMVGLAFPAPAAGDSRMACAGMLLSVLLGDAQQGGRLAARTLTGTEAAARYTPRADASLFVLTARAPDKQPDKQLDKQLGSQPSELTALEQKLIHAIRDLQTTPPSLDEFNAARQLALGRLQFDTETNGGMARTLGYAAVVDGDAPDALRTRIRQLTRADLQLYCRQYLNPDHALTVRLLPTTEITRGPSDAWTGR